MNVNIVVLRPFSNEATFSSLFTHRSTVKFRTSGQSYIHTSESTQTTTTSYYLAISFVYRHSTTNAGISVRRARSRRHAPNTSYALDLSRPQNCQFYCWQADMRKAWKAIMIVSLMPLTRNWTAIDLIAHNSIIF